MTQKVDGFYKGPPMFTIYTQPTKSAKVASYLDGKQPTAVPAKILAGTGNKEQLYKDWLTEEFKTNNKLINFLAKLFDVGQEYGHVALLVKSKHTAYQTKVVREFLIDHQEALKMMIPYLKQGMSVTKKNTDDLTEEEKATMNNGSSMTLGDLPASDRDQILALMRANQDAEEATTEAKPQNTTDV